ncbi:1,4-alpha-glucan-branching enzyme [Orobanche minor]
MFVCSSSVSTVLTDDYNTKANMDEYTENIDLFSLDQGLEAYKDHFRYKIRRYVDQKKLIEKHEASFEEFAQVIRNSGLTKKKVALCTVNGPQLHKAEVIGDFNGWNGSGHKMVKNQFGVWSIRIHVGGNPAIPHNSRVKFRFKHGDGVWVDRIPAWIKYATQDPTRFAAPYEGVYWDPPPSESAAVHFIASNNDSGVWDFDMEHLEQEHQK